MIKRSSALILILPGLFALLSSSETFAAKRKPVRPPPKRSSAVPAKTSKVAGNSSSSRALNLQKSSANLPSSQRIQAPPPGRSMDLVKPPRSNEFLEGGEKEKEYERLVDEEIKSLFKLSEQYRRSRSRGEIWLRLAERYVEKAQLIEFRQQAAFDRQMKEFNEKKIKNKPRLDLRIARDYNQKAVQLYEWFARDFPGDKKIDQALFFLGYNNFELGNTKKGEEFYLRLVREFPDSVYITESYFALGEFYFDNEKWQAAYDNYIKVVQARKARLNAFAMYKAGWCLFRLNRSRVALQMLERVVKISRGNEASDATPGGRRTVNRIRLGAEALKDYVPFYAETGDFKDARAEFFRISQSEPITLKMLERLAYIYADSGNRTAGTAVFKQLIGMNPSGERAADFQYQVILSYATSDPRTFKSEIEIWLENFGPTSIWARENGKNPKLVDDMIKLQETTVRNHVLQMHQSAQNSRASFSQQAAHEGYLLYTRYFANSPQAVEMQFFHAELLFDMRKFEEAAKLYTWVAEKDPQGKYGEMATINGLLALEKDLPSAKEIEEKRGKSVTPIPLDPPVQRFEQAANKYITERPKGEKVGDIRRRLGVLYYSYNQFDKAVEVFEQILNENPKGENAEIAGNLILDIYKLRGDMVGFAEKGKQFLSNPRIASTKFGQEVKGMMEKATYIRAEKIGEGKDYAKSAKEFEEFSQNFKTSDLLMPARYNAASNYEKAGDIPNAIRLHSFVLAVPPKDPKQQSIQNDSRNALARLYQQTGQLERAAKQYQSFAEANPKDQKAINAHFNAGVLFEALGENNSALGNYEVYLNKSGRGDRVEVLFLQAEIWRKRGSLGKASALYERYLKEGGRDFDHRVQSQYWMGRIMADSNKPELARQWFARTIESYRNGKKSGLAVRYAAEARFEMAQVIISDLRAIRFTRSDRQQAEAAGQIKKLREKYISEMKDVIRFDYAPMIVAALASTGQMLDRIAFSFSRIPVPQGITGDDAKKYQELVQKQIDEVRNEAKNSFKAAYERAMELESFSEWTQVAANGLKNHDPAFQAATEEVRVESRAGDWMGM